MKKWIFLIVTWGLFAPTFSHAAINIFACEPEWGSLAHEIGGDQLDITVATTARQDPHHIRAKPSLLAAMRNADLVICSGADLEVGWLPLLLQKAGSANVQPGNVGHVMAADYVKKIGVPEKLDRAMGDIHPQGNPHVHLNPHNMIPVAKEISKRLQQIDPDHKNLYTKNETAFLQKWQNAIQKWEQQAASLKNMAIVVHHTNAAYLIDWLGLKQVATLEPKPGLPPTASHLEDVLQKIKNQNVKFITRAPYENEQASQWVSEKTNIPMIVLPYTVDGDENLFSLFDQTIALLKGKS